MAYLLFDKDIIENNNIWKHVIQREKLLVLSQNAQRYVFDVACTWNTIYLIQRSACSELDATCPIHFEAISVILLVDVINIDVSTPVAFLFIFKRSNAAAIISKREIDGK